MQFVAGPPSKWLIALRGSRDVVEVWADGVSEQDGYIDFSILADATTDEQAHLHVAGRTPADPGRVIVTLARFPAATVDDYWSA